MIKVLHLLTGGGIGGIETLCREIAKTDKFENGFVFMSFGGSTYERMKKDGAVVYPLFELSSCKFSIKKAKDLIAISKDYDVIIVHNEDPYLEWYYCTVLKRTDIRGIRYVHSCYGDAWQRYKNPIKNYINKMVKQRAFDLSDKVCYVSNMGVESCHSMYKVRTDKEVIIYNGVSNALLDMGREAFWGRRHMTEDSEGRMPVNLLYVGRLESIKGVDLLLSAFTGIVTHHNAFLTLVGDGAERSRLEKYAEALGIDRKVSFVGAQTSIGRYLGEAHLFIYPSTCQEVFGISIVEAMAYGLPCVANDVGGIPEIIEDGANGFLTDEISDEGLHKAIERVLSLSDEKRRKIEAAARNTAENFSINRCLEKLWNVLENM